MKLKHFKSFLPNKRIFGDVPIENPNLGQFNSEIDWNFYNVLKSPNPKTKFNDFYEKDWMIKNHNSSFYIYQQIKNGKTYAGIITLVDALEIETGGIIPHEEILEDRCKKLGDYLQKFQIQSEPINLVCDNEDLETFIKEQTSKKPFKKFVKNGIFHTFWVLPPALNEEVINIGLNCKNVMIADGHHRLGATLQNHKNNPTINSQYVLSFLTTPKFISIHPYHRIFRVNSMQRNKIMEFIHERQFKEVITIPQSLSRNEVIIEIEGRLFFKNVALFKTDTIYSLLNKRILHPILNIHNLQKSEKINFIPGEKSIKEIISKKIDENQVRVFVPALSFENMLGLAKQKISLPPKSSWILPKLLTGLTVYNGKDE